MVECFVFLRPLGLRLIKLKRFNLEVNAKSIMGVMMLAAEMGSKITVSAEGPDEKEAVAAIVEVIETKFGEE